MAVYNVELRRSNGSNYEDKIYLKTFVGLVEGLLDANGKIKTSLLPSFMFGSMRFVSTWDGSAKCGDCKGTGQVYSGSTTCTACNGTGEINGLACGFCAGKGTIETYEDCETCGGDGVIDSDNNKLSAAKAIIEGYVAINGGSLRGCYFIASQAITLAVYSPYVLHKEEQDTDSTTIESGDWLICMSDNGYTWGIINNTYQDATTTSKGIVELATEQEGVTGTSTSLAMTPKATVAAINARTYSHPTYTGKNETFSAVETLSVLSVNSLGHVTSFAKQAIRVASESQTGLIQLASSSEAKAATVDTKATSPLRVKEMIDKFASIPIVQSLPTDMSDHPAGKLILLQI
jgi:hypothetical protein